MSTPAQPNEVRLERFRHRRYETVRGDDLSAQAAVLEGLQAWHNRALHRAYGVVFGLGVDVVGPEAGPRDVRVDPGLAYDATGRPVALTRETRIPLPFDTVGLTLVLRGLAGPALAWVPTDGFHITDGVGVAKSRGDSEPLPIRLKQPTVPASLASKVSYDPAHGKLTIHGLLSPGQKAELEPLVEEASRGELETAYTAWPLEAPRRSVNSGLEVRIEDGRKEADGTLWQVTVTGGSVFNDTGNLLVLSATTSLPLDGNLDHYTLAIQPTPTGAVVRLRDAPPTATERAVVLAVISAKQSDPVTLPEGLRVEVPAVATRLASLKARNKVSYDDGAGQLRVIGFLTRVDRDDLVNIVAASDLGMVPDLHRQLKANRPQKAVPAASSERPPFFPIRSRPLARQRTASGESPHGLTDWKLLTKDLVDVPGADGNWQVYETTIDLSAAGFTAVPQVFAWLQCRRPRDEPANSPPSRALRGDIDDVRVSNKQFHFRVWFLDLTAGQGPTPGLAETLEYLRKRVSVRWLAVQSEEPPLDYFTTRRRPVSMGDEGRGRP